MTEHLQVDEEAQRVLLELGELCRSALDRFRDFGQRTRWRSTSDDIAPREAESRLLAQEVGPGGPWGGGDVDRIAQTASFLLPVAGQYLAGMSALLKAHEVIFPLAPVVRSLLEVCGRICWLLDPELGNVRARSARYFLIRLDDLQRTKTLAYALDHRQHGTELGHALRDLKTREIPERFQPDEVVFLKGGRLILVNQRLPGLRDSVEITDRIFSAGNAGGMYDYLSAASHPTMLIALEMLDRDTLGLTTDDASAGAGAPEARELRFRLGDMKYPTTLTQHAVVTFVQAWRLVASYHGLDVPEADALFDQIEEL